MKPADVLTGVLVALETMASTLKEPIEKAATEGAAKILRGLVELLANRTPAECLTILEKIRDHGAQAITSGELDAQVAAAIARGKDG